MGWLGDVAAWGWGNVPLNLKIIIVVGVEYKTDEPRELALCSALLSHFYKFASGKLLNPPNPVNPNFETSVGLSYAYTVSQSENPIHFFS
jgi:hypothetical protein